MSVCPAQNFSNPPLVPEIPTVTCAYPYLVETLSDRLRDWETVLDPSTLIRAAGLSGWLGYP